MISRLCLVLLSYVALAQADVVSEGQEYLRGLADEYKEGVAHWEKASAAAKANVDAQYKSVQERLITSTRAKADSAIRKAEQLKCHQDAIKGLRQIREAPLDRFKECVDFTQTLVDFEKLLYNVTLEVVSYEEVVCETIRNLTECTTHGNWFDKVQCVLTRLEDYLSTSHNYNGLIDFAEEVNEMARQVTVHFTNCFLDVDDGVTKGIKHILINKCKP